MGDNPEQAVADETLQVLTHLYVRQSDVEKRLPEWTARIGIVLRGCDLSEQVTRIMGTKLERLEIECSVRAVEQRWLRIHMVEFGCELWQVGGDGECTTL